MDTSVVIDAEPNLWHSTSCSIEKEYPQYKKPLTSINFIDTLSNNTWYNLLTTSKVLFHVVDDFNTINSSFFEQQSTVISWLTYRNSSEVQSYLAHHPEINEFLKTAYPVLQHYFGEEVKVILEVLTYAEEGSQAELVGWIQSTDEVLTGLEKLEQFEDEWFLDNCDLVASIFNFNIETR